MIGFQVLKRTRQVDEVTIESFRNLPIANVSDSMSRLTAGGAKLRPMHSTGKLAGTALTVKTRPGDSLMLHKALNMAGRGDVIVVDGGGDLTNSLMGEMMAAYAERKGLAGIVIFGAIRDYDSIKKGTFPIFAAGVTHRGPYRDGPGEINVPIAIDGMVVQPGDVILGDGDGIVCIPFEQTDQILVAARQRYEAELIQQKSIIEGNNDRSWVDALLKKLGCVIER